MSRYHHISKKKRTSKLNQQERKTFLPFAEQSNDFDGIRRFWTSLVFFFFTLRCLSYANASHALLLFCPDFV